MLKEWKDQLQNRSVEEKRGTKGKLIGATYTQTQEYVKPLLRKLKNFTLPEDISDSLTEIVVHLLNRNYLKVIITRISKRSFFKKKNYFRLATLICKWQ